MQSDIKGFAFRLKPHADLKNSILEFARGNDIQAGAIVTCVGSVEHLSIRFANEKTSSSFTAPYEIVSLTGTFSVTSCHLHISCSDATGKTIGGHLLEGTRIFTTAELVIVKLVDLAFLREPDPTYGYNELVVKSAQQ